MNEFLKGGDEKPKSDFIEVYGAREHNLKNIDISIPKNKLVVTTGMAALLR